MSSDSSTSRLTFDQRLDTHFATLRSPSLREVLKRSAGRWQVYAAVTGSAMAMATGASAAVIHNGVEDAAADPAASVRAVSQRLASSRNVPFVNDLARATTQAQAPVILPGGIVPLFSTVNVIQSGEWISIYGTNLANATVQWNGDFPTSLGGTTVEIDGKPAYLLFVSSGQINLQVPDDMATGTVSVVVHTASGSATATVTLSQFAPSFLLLDTKHVAGIILRKDGSGAYGGGTYDILGPTGDSLGFPTVAAAPGDNVVLFSTGFGPTTPSVPAGAPYSGAATLNNAVSLYVGDVIVKTTFAGIASAGMVQLNLRIPYGLGTGDVPLQAMVGGVLSQRGVVISLRDLLIGGGGSTNVPPVTYFPILSSHPVFTSFPPGSGGAGSGGGSSQARRKAFLPKKLQFPPK